MHQKYRFAVVAFGMVLATGCGGGSGAPEVGGTIALQGKPLAGVSILLIPEQHGSPRLVGSSDHEGKFHLTTTDQQKGTAAGSYRVVVTDPRALSASASKDPFNADMREMPKNPPIPSKYTREQSTTLNVEVRAGSPLLLDLVP